MRVAFRTDSSAHIGIGHVMRCLNLALALRERGDEVLFISREMTGDISAHVEASGLRVHRLPAPGQTEASTRAQISHRHWLGVPVEQDAAETLCALRQFCPDWLVVDHYGIGLSWESGMRGLARKIFAIDDLADRKHDCNMLLDQNYFPNPAERYVGRLSPDTRLLTGPRYALLRKEYARLREGLRAREKVSRLLVFVGGGDQSETLLKVIEALRAPALGHVETEVVLGNSISLEAEIKVLLRCIPRVRIYAKTDDMAGLIDRADLCVGAGGVSVWERACLGLPSVVIAVAKHQVEPAQAMARSGYIVYLGEANGVAPQDVVQAVTGLIDSPDALRAMSVKVCTLVDGRGAQRVCEEMQ